METWLLSEREALIELTRRFADLINNLDHARTGVKHVQQEAVCAAYPPYGEDTRMTWSDKVWDRHEEIINSLDDSIEDAQIIGDLLNTFTIQHHVDEDAPEQLSWFN